MASSLQELIDRRTALETKLIRLKNQQKLMHKPNKQLDGEVYMTDLRLQEVRRMIDAHNKR